MSAHEHHADPFAEASADGLSRAVRLTSIGATLLQIFAQVRAQRETVRAEQAEHSAHIRRNLLKANRLRWAPAHDAKWLRTADLTQTARVWGAAVLHMDSDVSAAQAVRACEERLRRLHPHAMEHYDRFRADGLGSVEAMRKAAPFFTRDPNVRTGDPAPVRAALLAAYDSPQRTEAARLAGSDFPHSVSESVRATTHRGTVPSTNHSPAPIPKQNRTP
jgi:hypothetical protein